MAKKRSKGNGKAKIFNGDIKTVKSDLQQIIAGKVTPTLIIQNRQLLKQK